MELHKKKCVPCRGDIPPFTKNQIDEYLKFGWGYAEVNIYTHAIKGLSLSDFILASKIDMISV